MQNSNPKNCCWFNALKFFLIMFPLSRKFSIKFDQKYIYRSDGVRYVFRINLNCTCS